MSETLSVLPAPPSDPDRARGIIRIVREVEIAKISANPLTDQQREALVRLLHGTGKSIAEIAEMGRRVVERNTFGRMAFDCWVEQPAEVPKISIHLDCIYCGAEWWGPPGTRCPNCFPETLTAALEKPLPRRVTEIAAPIEKQMGAE